MTELLSEIIGRHVALTRRGRQRYVGLSPFRQERTPSLAVDDATGRWHDFASGQGGDAAAFLRRMAELETTRPAGAGMLGGPVQSDDVLIDGQSIERYADTVNALTVSGDGDGATD